jgi:hypothetical protein
VRRLVLVIVTALAFAATLAASAFADAGPPGSTFPEQPGTHSQTACAAVLSNPGTGPGGPASQNMSPTAGAITSGLFADACLGG